MAKRSLAAKRIMDWPNHAAPSFIITYTPLLKKKKANGFMPQYCKMGDGPV